MRSLYLAFVALLLAACGSTDRPALLLRHATLIDGNGGTPRQNVDVLVVEDTIVAIGENLVSVNGTTTVVDLQGKTIMPALISTHVHIGTLKGTKTVAENYTYQNILDQLQKYEQYGVLNLLSMGTDRELLFQKGWYDSLKNGHMPGARLYSAGFGFGVPNAAPPVSFGMDKVFRPDSVGQVAVEMDSLVQLKPAVVKMWVDDFGGKFTKMNPAISRAIIQEGHRHNLRVATHLYYLSDARRLINDGVDIIAHSIRDSVIDDKLLLQMKEKNLVYIPTLSLDEYAYIYARKPDWINDEFFKASLEPGVYEMITSQKYQDDLRNAPDYHKKEQAFETALKNLKKIFDAGILVSLGTDSGATPVRAQGFSEHLELELMVQAGLTPLQAISVGTKNAATVLKIDDHYGTLAPGKTADFIILSANPADDIKNTRKIESVYKAGKKVR